VRLKNHPRVGPQPFASFPALKLGPNIEAIETDGNSYGNNDHRVRISRSFNYMALVKGWQSNRFRLSIAIGLDRICTMLSHAKMLPVLGYVLVHKQRLTKVPVGARRQTELAIVDGIQIEASPEDLSSKDLRWP